MKTFQIVGQDLSDGYHTFGELYQHRVALFIALCRELQANPAYQTGQKSFVWRSRLHSDGSSFDGWFVMGIGALPGEQITYHLPLDSWGSTDFADTLDRAPAFDGHSPSDVLERLQGLGETRKSLTEICREDVLDFVI